MKKITKLLYFLVFTLFFNGSIFAQTTYTFTGAGSDGSGNNTGHKTISTNPSGANIEISDNMTHIPNLFYPDASGDVTVTFTIKGDGINVGSFDVNDMNWGNFTGSSQLDEAVTKIIFTKTDLTTVTWNSFKPAYQTTGSFTTTNHSVLDIFTAGSTVTNVTQVEITVDLVGGGSTQNFELRNITLANLTAPEVCTTPDVPTITYSPTNVCDGNNATLNISGSLNDATQWAVYTSSCGGTLVGTTTTSTITVTPSTPSTTYYVRGEGGCVTPGSCGTVTVNTISMSTSIIVTDVSCNGADDGSLTINPSGGTNPYQYSLNNGTTFSSSNIFNNLTSGTYNVIVKDANGCNALSSNIVINEPALLNTTTMITKDITCIGNNDGEALATAIGGTPPYTYLWTNSTGTTVSTTASVTNLSPGNFNVEVTDANGCTMTNLMTINNPAPEDASFSYSAASYCTDASDPSPTITGLTGGSFSSTAGLSIASNGTIDVSASTPGTYIVTYTTAGTCPNSSTASVTINSLDDASFNYSAAAYCTDTSDPSPTITGLTGGSFSSTTGLSIASNGTIDVSASTPGTYTVTYTTAGTCPNSSTASVTINSLDNASFNYSAASYASTDSDPTPTITGLAGGTFSSTVGLNINSSTGTIDVSTSIPNTYTVTYTTAGTCPNSSNTSVSITGNYIWTGTTDSDWTKASNWNYNAIPTTSSDVVIPGGLSHYPTVNSAIVDVSKIYFQPGATAIFETITNADVEFKRSINSTDWKLVCAPVSGETIENMLTNNSFDQGTTSSNKALSFYTNSGASAWDYQTSSSTGTITNGKGIAVKLGAPNLIFNGKMNTGPVSIAISKGDRTDFNLIGNPYTAYVNSSAFLNNLSNMPMLSEQTIWLWDGTKYVTRNLANPIEISPAQGFFVKAGINGSVSVNTAMLSHQNSDTFMRNSKTSIELIAKSDKSEKSTQIFYLNGKTKGFDNGYDSTIFGGSSNSFSVYSQLVTDNQGKNYAIQSLPLEDMENIVVPIGLNALTGKKINFSISSKNLPNNTKVYLEDRVNKQFIDITDANHTVTLKNDINGIGQFYLRTTSQKIDTPIATSIKEVSIYKSAPNTLSIVGLQAKNAAIKVFSLLGKEVANQSLTSNGFSTVNLPSLAAGIYIIELTSELGKTSKKIILE